MHMQGPSKVSSLTAGSCKSNTEGSSERQTRNDGSSEVLEFGDVYTCLSILATSLV